MKAVLQLFAFIYTLIFVVVFTALLVLCVAKDSLSPQSLSKSMVEVDFTKIKIGDLKDEVMINKYGADSTLMDMLVIELIDPKQDKEEAVKIINHPDYRNMFFEVAYAGLFSEPISYTDVEMKKALDPLKLYQVDYKEMVNILNEKASNIKIDSLANNVWYDTVISVMRNVEFYTIIVVIVSYLLLALFNFNFVKPMQSVGYTMTLIGVFLAVGSFLLEMALEKLMMSDVRLLLAPFLKASMLKYGIISTVVGFAMSAVYEAIDKKQSRYDNDLFDFSIGKVKTPKPGKGGKGGKGGEPVPAGYADTHPAVAPVAPMGEMQPGMPQMGQGMSPMQPDVTGMNMMQPNMTGMPQPMAPMGQGMDMSGMQSMGQGMPMMGQGMPQMGQGMGMPQAGMPYGVPTGQMQPMAPVQDDTNNNNQIS